MYVCEHTLEDSWRHSSLAAMSSLSHTPPSSSAMTKGWALGGIDANTPWMREDLWLPLWRHTHTHNTHAVGFYVSA